MIDSYKESLGIAYETLKTEANKNSTIKWKYGTDVVLYGEKVKMFQATESQYKNSDMFGRVNYHYPDVNLSGNNSTNLLTRFNELGRLNGLDETASKVYSSELFKATADGNRSRQRSSDILENDYFHYVTSPKGIAEPVYPEVFLLGLGSKGVGAVSKGIETAAASSIESIISRTLTRNAAIGLGSNTSLQLLSGQDFNWYELGGAGIAGAISPQLSTRDAIRFNGNFNGGKFGERWKSFAGCWISWGRCMGRQFVFLEVV